MTLTKLIFNKTIVFNTPVECENVPMVRTGGVDYNESEPLYSLINCSLHANIKKYGSMKDDERKMKIQKIKEEVYEQIKNGDVNKNNITSFLNSVKDNIINFNLYLNSTHYTTEYSSETNKTLSELLLGNGNIDQINLFKLLYEIITVDSFKKILRNTEQKWGRDFCIVSYKKIVFKEILRFLSYQDYFDDLDKTKADFLTKKLVLMVNTIVDLSFSNITKKSNFITSDIDATKINILSKYFDCNIIFIDSEDRIPYIIDKQDISDQKKYILVFAFEQKHFEIVGKLLPDDRIQRNFMPYEDILKKVNFYLKKKQSDDVKKDNGSEERANQVPVSQESANQVPVSQESANQVPVSEESANQVPVPNECANQVPIPDECANQEPVSEESANQEPVSEESANQVPVSEESANQVPIPEESANQAPIPDESANQVPVVDHVNENLSCNNSDDELMSVLGDE